MERKLNTQIKQKLNKFKKNKKQRPHAPHAMQAEQSRLRRAAWHTGQAACGRSLHQERDPARLKLCEWK